jgi:hypothetical protein
MSLYILERPSSWSTSRIRPSCPQSRVRLNLLLDLFPQVYSCLLWPTQYLAVCFNSSHFALDPFLACWQLNTCVKVNNTSALHHIHEDTHIYIILILFILLLLYTSSTPFGRPVVLGPSCWSLLQFLYILIFNSQSNIIYLSVFRSIYYKCLEYCTLLQKTKNKWNFRTLC